MRAASARDQPQDSRLQWGHLSLSPMNVGEGATKLHLELWLPTTKSVNDLFAPTHLTCLSLCCAYGHQYGRSEVMSRVHSLMGTRCRDTLPPVGREMWMLPGVVGRLAVQLPNPAGTDLHQFYGCV